MQIKLSIESGGYEHIDLSFEMETSTNDEGRWIDYREAKTLGEAINAFFADAKKRLHEGLSRELRDLETVRKDLDEIIESLGDKKDESKDS